MINYKFLVLVISITFSPLSMSEDYQTWDKKYPLYKSLFSDNKKLEENKIILQQKLDDHTKGKVKNFKKSDVDKAEFYNSIIDEFDRTISSTNIFGQSLIFAYESDLRPIFKQYHFRNICSSLNIVSKKSAEITVAKSDVFIEWGSKHLPPSELNLVKDSLKLNNSIITSVNRVCGQISNDESFWTK